MKGPADKPLADAIHPAFLTEPSKVLARLRQFERQRSLPESGVTEATSDTAIASTMRTAAATAVGPREEISPYLAAFRDMEATEPAFDTAVPVPQGWRPLGPFAIPHGQTYGGGTGNRPGVAGRVSAIAVDPSNAAHVLIGAAGGGVWETRDAAQTWNPRTDAQPSCAIGAIAFDPSNPSIVYSGTGEGDFFRRLGLGILKSADGGTSWILAAETPFSGIGFYDILVDPGNPSHILAATSGGLYASSDAGTTWVQRRAQVTWDFSIGNLPGGGPGGTQEILAACADGLFSSTDGGAAWTPVALAGAPAGLQRMEVSHAASNPAVAYAFAAGTTGTAHLWRRQSANGSFSAETLPAVDTGQSWYDWFLGVAPNDPDVVYLGEITAWRGERAGGSWTWTDIASKTVGDSIHPDQHAIAFSPANPDHLFVGSDGGIFFSPDRGNAWISLNKGLCIAEFEYMAQHPQYDAWLVGGTQDNGTQRYEGEEVWYHVQDGDGGDCGINGTSPSTSYHSFYSMGLERSTTGGSWGTWAGIGPVPPAGHSSLFYPPMEVNGNVVVQAGSSAFISTDTGTTWNEVALPSGVATALAIPDAVTVYVASSDGNIYRISQSGGVWQPPQALTKPRAGWVSDLLVDPTNPNRIWATYSNMTGSHVFRSDNAGGAWNDVSAGLPTIPVNAIEVDPNNTNVVWIAADVGVYRSTDAGATWAAYNNLLPNALAKDLVFVPSQRLLRVATQSRGVWEIDVDNPTMPDTEIYLRDSTVDTGRRLPSPSGVPDPFAPGSNTHWWQCTDIKVDSPPFQQAALGDVDYLVFNDDHGVNAQGLTHENTLRNRTVRVFVQLHNRGLVPAQNVAVKVFFADASAGLPPLPSGFWTNFPNNALPSGSPWQAIGPPAVVPVLETARPAVVGFEWNVPGTTANHTCLLAILTADNDPIATTETDIGVLVTGNKRCGLKNLAVVDPPAAGPMPVVELNLWGGRNLEDFTVLIEDDTGRRVRGLILSKRLAKYAEEAQLERTKLSEDEEKELARLTKSRPHLNEELELGVAFRGSKGDWRLPNVVLDRERPEPMVLLLHPKSPQGRISIVQWDERRRLIVGGLTVEIRRKPRN